VTRWPLSVGRWPNASAAPRVCVSREVEPIMRNQNVSKNGVVTPEARASNVSVRWLVLFVGISVAMRLSAGSDVTDEARLLGLSWRSLTIKQALEEIHDDNLLELSASVDDAYRCGPVRTLSKFSDVRDGFCLRCYHLEFLSANQDSYSLHNMRVDDVAPTAGEIIAKAKRLLTASGVASTRIALINFHLPMTKWSANWVKDQEYRAVEMSVDRRGRLWHLRFFHLREPTPGALDTH
jgi:hypothetical protein